MGSALLLTALFLSAPKARADDCSLDAVKAATKKPGKSAIVKALDIKPEKGKKPCKAKKAGAYYVLPGFFTQPDCAELLVLYRPGPVCKKSPGPFHVAILKLEGKKLKKVLDLGHWNNEIIEKPQIMDFSRDRVSEFLVTEKFGGIELDEKGKPQSISPEVHVATLYQMKDKTPDVIFSIQVFYDDTVFKTTDKETGKEMKNPPYTEKVSSIAFEDVDGDGHEDVAISTTTTLYADAKHKDVIEKNEATSGVLYFAGGEFKDPEDAARLAILKGDPLQCIKVLEKYAKSEITLTLLAVCVKAAGKMHKFYDYFRKIFERKHVPDDFKDIPPSYDDPFFKPEPEDLPLPPNMPERLEKIIIMNQDFKSDPGNG